MIIADKISKAKAKLLVDYPYFGTVASKLELIKNEDIEAFVSDGIKLEYNPDFIGASSIAELEFVFANGAMHASMAYDNRQNNRSPWLWQLASEYAINDMLVENGLERPYQAHFSERFSGWYTEEIYADLKADILMDAEEIDNSRKKDKRQTEQKQEKEHEQKNVSQNEFLEEQLFASFSQNSLAKELKSGRPPKSIERFFKIQDVSKVNWQEELRDALDKYAKDDYTQMPPNKKFLSQGIYLPSATSETFELVIAIDSSGSVDEILLNEFLSEVNALMLCIPKYKIDVIVCDDKIRAHQEYMSGEFLDLSVVGGGATDFAPVFEFVERELFSPKLLLYFTDLEGSFPKQIPTYEVKWLSPRICEIPFGEIIQL